MADEAHVSPFQGSGGSYGTSPAFSLGYNGAGFEPYRTLTGFAEAGDEGAVGDFIEGEEFAVGFQFEPGGVGEEFADDGFVFFGFEAAGAVNQCAAGFESGGGFVQKIELGGAEAVKFFGANAPAEVHAAAHDAGVGTGGVDQYPIKFQICQRTLALTLAQ